MNDEREPWTPEAIASVIGLVLAVLFVGGCIVHGVRHDARIQACYQRPTEAAQNKCMSEL